MPNEGGFWAGYIRYIRNLQWPPKKMFAWVPTRTETGTIWLTCYWRVRVGESIHYRPSDHGQLIAGPHTPVYKRFKPNDLMRARLANEL